MESKRKLEWRERKAHVRHIAKTCVTIHYLFRLRSFLSPRFSFLAFCFSEFLSILRRNVVTCNQKASGSIYNNNINQE